MDKPKIKIIRKNDEYSAEYQVGDIFQVDSTWYGGVNVTSAAEQKKNVTSWQQILGHCFLIQRTGYED